MPKSNYPGHLFAILLASFLALVGSAQAQLQYFAKTSNIEDLIDPDIDTIFDEIAAGKIYQVKITGSIIPTVDTSGSPFGINAASSTPVPVIAYVMVDTTRTGPKVTGGNGHIGYQGNQILAVYIHIGPENNPLHEIGYVNFPPLTSDFSPSALTSVQSGGSGPFAEFWVNQDLDTGNPTIASVRLDNGPNDSFRFGPIHGDVYVQESPDHSAGGVTDVLVRNLTLEFTTFFQEGERTRLDLAVAKAIALSKLKKLKKKAKKLKKKADDPASKKKAKKAKKKVKSAQALLNGASNETIIFEANNFGNDTVMNFMTSSP